MGLSVIFLFWRWVEIFHLGTSQTALWHPRIIFIFQLKSPLFLTKIDILFKGIYHSTLSKLFFNPIDDCAKIIHIDIKFIPFLKWLNCKHIAFNHFLWGWLSRFFTRCMKRVILVGILISQAILRYIYNWIYVHWLIDRLHILNSWWELFNSKIRPNSLSISAILLHFHLWITVWILIAVR